MNQEQYFKNLKCPSKKIDVVLDTDAYNEIDDQFAIAYLLKHSEKLCVKGICAAPFLNSNSRSPEDGMLKSYDEILRLLGLTGNEGLKTSVYHGSPSYLSDEITPVDSPAADFLAELANRYSPQDPLFVVAIGAITNVASAILRNPAMTENCVLIWLGGHALHEAGGVREFNMVQDIAAARIVFGCGIPLVQLPCMGVVDQFTTTKYELEHWLKGKNALCDYLYANSVRQAECRTKYKAWSRVIWDVTAVAWLLNENQRFMKERLIPAPIPEYNKEYSKNENRHFIKYVYRINRDALFDDLFCTLIS